MGVWVRIPSGVPKWFAIITLTNDSTVDNWPRVVIICGKV